MKVIRLVEDIKQYKELVDYGKSLGLDNATINSILKAVQAQPATLSGANYMQFEDALKDAADNANKEEVTPEKPKANTKVEKDTDEKPTPTNVDEVRRAFENKALFGKNGEAAKELLYKLFDQIGKYGNNNASNIKNVLNNFDVKFIRYFLECLGYDRLANKDNLVLVALANKNANNFINGNKDNFTNLFNIVSDNYLDITTDYLSQEDALLFNRDVYKAATSFDQFKDLIQLDVKGEINRNDVLSNIRNGLDQFISSKTSNKSRVISKTNDAISKLSDQEFKDTLTSQGVSQKVVDVAAIERRQNIENNNR